MSIKYISKAEYARRSNLSRKTVDIMVEEGKLVTAPSENGGSVKILWEGNEDLEKMTQELKEVKGILSVLCKHLGVQQSELARLIS